MILKQDREWYVRHAALDEPSEVAAGEFSFDKLPPSTAVGVEADRAFSPLTPGGWPIEELPKSK